MKPYSVKLFWLEPDGSPNMMMCNVQADIISLAIQRAITMLHTAHFIVDPIRIEASVQQSE